jgi:hypothetical protein
VVDHTSDQLDGVSESNVVGRFRLVVTHVAEATRISRRNKFREVIDHRFKRGEFAGDDGAGEVGLLDGIGATRSAAQAIVGNRRSVVEATENTVRREVCSLEVA